MYGVLTLWEVELECDDEDGESGRLHFAALAENGEDAVDYVLEEHEDELEGLDIGRAYFSPACQKSLFRYWEADAN